MFDLVNRTVQACKRGVARVVTKTRQVCSTVVEKGKAFLIGGVVTVVTFGAPAIVEASPSGPPPMPDVEFPIEPATIVAKFVQYGGLILGLIFAVALGFILVKKLFWNVQKTA